MSTPSGEVKRSNNVTSLLICLIEAPSCLVLGVSLMLGHLGPYALPIQFYLPVGTLLSGVSMFTTVVLCLLMREHYRALAFNMK